MLEAAIFDMDGLLINSEPLWHKAEIKVFSSLGLNLTSEMCIPFTGVRVDTVVRHWYRQCHHPEKSLAQVEKEVIEEVQHLALKDGCMMPGVEEALMLCRERGLALAVASSSPLPMIEAVLVKLDIRHYFSVMCSAAEEQYGKPHPAVYLHTAQQLGFFPGNCLAFEDSFPGVVAALAANMKVVAVPDSHHRDNSRFNAATLTLPSLLGFDGHQLDRLMGKPSFALG